MVTVWWSRHMTVWFCKGVFVSHVIIASFAYLEPSPLTPRHGTTLPSHRALQLTANPARFIPRDNRTYNALSELTPP